MPIDFPTREFRMMTLDERDRQFGMGRREPEIVNSPQARELLNLRMAARSMLLAAEPLMEYRRTMDLAGVPGWNGVLWEQMDETLRALGQTLAAPPENLR